MKIEELQFRKIAETETGEGYRRRNNPIPSIYEVDDIINLSEIVTELLKATSSMISYHSDMLYVIDDMRLEIVLAQDEEYQKKSLFAGVRKSTVSPKSFIKEKLEKVSNWQEVYDKIYRIDIENIDDTIIVSLNIAE